MVVGYKGNQDTPAAHTNGTARSTGTSFRRWVLQKGGGASCLVIPRARQVEEGRYAPCIWGKLSGGLYVVLCADKCRHVVQSTGQQF